MSKIRSGHFIDLDDLLAENLKAQETEPQTYLDGKLLVSSTKKRVQEITDIVTWVEAFTVYSWILCGAHPSRWQDTTQYKLLILKTARQFSGKAWLHYDIAFRKDAAASGLVDWSHMNLDLYNFHTRASPSNPACRQTSNLQLHHWWPVHPIFVDPGMMVSVAGLAVNAVFATPVRGVKDSTPVSIVLFSLHSPVSSAHGQLPLLGVNTSGVSSSKTACQRNFVNIVNAPCSVLPSNVMFPMSVNAVPVTQDLSGKTPRMSVQFPCSDFSSFTGSLQRDLVPPSRVTPIKAEKLHRELCSHPDQAQVDFVISGLSQGFHLGFDSLAVSLQSASHNMPTASLQPSVIDQYLLKEL